MTYEYGVNQSADKRKEAATQRIRDKIAVLELWEHEGTPEGYEWSERDDPDKKHGCPTSISEFTKWNDSSLEIKVHIDGKKHTVKGIYHLSAVTLNKPERSALKKRAQEILASINKRPAPKKEVAKLKAELKVAEAFTQHLVNENAKLRHEIAAMNEDMGYVQTINGNLTDRITDLERELESARKMRGLHTTK